MKLLITFLILIILMSCIKKTSSTVVKAEYDTLAVVHSMLGDSLVREVLYNDEKSEDSLYILRTDLTDSLLSRIKVKNKKIGFLTMPKVRPYQIDKMTDKQIIWFRILKLDTVVATGETFMNRSNIIQEIHMRKEYGVWIIENTNTSRF